MTRPLACLLLVFGLGAQAGAQIKVVATLPDLGALAQAVGGGKVKVTSLAVGTEDPHFVDAKPSFIRVLNQADLLIEGGAELEIGWLPPLVQNARNRKILAGQPGRLDASQGVRLLEVPAGPLDRSQGDVHALGNPHYLLDPANGRVVATSIAQRLAALDPPNAAFYEANLRAFHQRLDTKLAEWMQAMEPLGGKKAIAYHKSYEYLAARFGLQIAGYIEPKPGIEPSPTHINQLISSLKDAGVKLVLIEPFRSRRTPEYVAQSVGARVVVLPEMPGGHEKAKDYFSLFDYAVGQMTAALAETK
jgi:zinc/manganese transport system substrate-binding protein